MIVRAIAPSDEEAYRSILERTSPEDRYCRFFHHVDHFDPAEVHRFVEERADMFSAVPARRRPGRGARAVVDDATAELGIVVAMDARGAGSAMRCSRN